MLKTTRHLALSGVFLALLAGFGPAGARAQAVTSTAELPIEVTPFVGYLFGGALAVEGGELRLDSGGNWGLLVDIPMYRFDGAQLELSYERLDSDMTFKGSGYGGDERLFDVIVEYWHAGILQEFESESAMRPFALISLGATGIKPQESGFSDEWMFSGIIGGGGKYMFADHLGLRAEARLITSFISSSASFLCGSNGCFVTIGSEVMFQANFNIGLIIAL